MCCMKVLAGVVIATAVTVASLLLVLHSSDLVKQIFMIPRFFEAMLPILAAGALLKYLLTFKSRS